MMCRVNVELTCRETFEAVTDEGRKVNDVQRGKSTLWRRLKGGEGKG